MKVLQIDDHSILMDKITFDLLNRLGITPWVDKEGYAQIYYLSKCIYLHRFIMSPVKEGLVVDHLDKNRLNNQKSNLSIVDYSANIHNRFRSKARSGAYGVQVKTLSNGDLVYLVSISYKRKVTSKSFSSLDLAEEYYDLLALKNFGSSAVLNNPKRVFNLDRLNALDAQSNKRNQIQVGGFSFSLSKSRWEVRYFENSKRKRKYFNTEIEASDYFNSIAGTTC